MGWEYAITIQNSNYREIIEILYNEFSSFSKQYTIIKNADGFSINDDSLDWPEIMQMTIFTADTYTYNIPNGQEYICCTFHIGGTEAYRLKEQLKSILTKTTYAYIIMEL